MIIENKRWSIAGVLLIGAMIPLMLLDGGFDNLLVYGVNIFIVSGLWLMVRKKPIEKINLSLKSPGLWMLLFVLWGFISVLWSVHPHRTMVEAIQVLMGLLIYLLARNVDSQEEETIARLLCIAGTGAAIYSAAQYAILGIYDGTLTNANPFCIMLVMISLMCWGLSVRKEKTQWVAMIACGVMMSQVLVLSSRMSLVAFITSAIFLYWRLPKTLWKKKFFETMGLVTITIVMAQIVIALKNLGAPVEPPTLTETVVNPSSLNNSFFARLSFFRQALGLFMKKPINGIGLGTFFLADKILLPDSGINSRFVHNHYLQVLAELGLVGELFFLGVFFTTLWLIGKQLFSKENKQHVGYIAMFIAFSIHIVSDFTFNFPVCLAFFFMAIGLIERNQTKTQASELNSLEKVALVCAFAITLYVGIPSMQYERIANETSIERQIEKMNRVNKIYPINAAAYSFVSKAYSENDKLNFAIEQSEKAVEWCEVDGDLHYQLAQLYVEAGRIKEAEQQFIQARDYAGADLSLIIQLAYFYLWQNQMDSAKEVLIDGIEQAKELTEFEKNDGVTNYIKQMTDMLANIEEKQ